MTEPTNPEQPGGTSPDEGAPPPQPGAPPPPAAGPSGSPGSGGQPASTGGLDPKVGALLSYLLFGWIGGIIMYFTQKHPEVRFHAAQSIVVFGAWTVIGILVQIFQAAAPGGLAVIIGLLWALVGLAVFVLWIILCIKGYNLEHFKVPIAGDYAEQMASK